MLVATQVPIRPLDPVHLQVPHLVLQLVLRVLSPVAGDLVRLVPRRVEVRNQGRHLGRLTSKVLKANPT